MLGSGEFQPWSAEVDQFMLEHSSVGDGSVAILLAASAPEGDETFEGWALMGLEHYKSLDIESFVIPIKVREDAFNDSYIQMLDRASYIFFSGGNPAYLADTLRDTPFWARVLSLREAGASLGGCSAGACVMGEHAPDPTAMHAGEDAIKHPGLAVMRNCVFGAHWDMLDTYVLGLRDMIRKAVPEDWTLIGIDEDTALVYDDGDWCVFGQGGVHMYRKGQTVTL